MGREVFHRVNQREEKRSGLGIPVSGQESRSKGCKRRLRERRQQVVLEGQSKVKQLDWQIWEKRTTRLAL